MKILIVSNQIFEDGRVTNPIMPRMKDSLLRDERVDEVLLMPVSYSFTGLKRIRKAAKKADLVHVHFGGMYALIVWFSMIGVNCPKIITFHGTDIHAKAIKTAKSVLRKAKIKLNQYSSFWSISLFDRCGFVAEEMKGYVPGFLSKQLKKKAFVQKLGVDYNVFKIKDKEESQEELGLGKGHYVLFSDISGSSIKRRDLAESIIRGLGDNYKMLLMCGVKPDQVPLYINSSDFLILTSDEEGSPNIIRECLALNKPVFSVKVGDAEKQLQDLENSCIISREPEEAARAILKQIQKTYTDNSREKLQNQLNFDVLNSSIIDLYAGMCDNKERLKKKMK